MLGKRLVDYSDEEDAGEEGNLQQGVEDTIPTEEAPKKKKVIPYARMGTKNLVASLLTAPVFSQQKAAEDLLTNEPKRRQIEFETVTGKRTLVIDEPKEKVWKSKQTREPFYYKAMKEIYHDRLAKATGTGEEEQEIMPTTQAATETMAEIGGRQERVVDVSQKDLINFDYEKYMATKERKELLVEERVKRLQAGTLDARHDKLALHAYELIEKEAAAEAMGAPLESGIKRNKKQYGF